MADDIDRMLQGDDTSSASQAQTGQQDDTTQQVVQQTEEEVAFNTLSGSAQDRVRELVRRAKEAEEQLTQRQQQFVPQQTSTSPDDQAILQTLSSRGVAIKEDVQKEVSSVKNEILGELQKQRLMQQYPGNDNLPKYDPFEVSDYKKTHPEYSQTPDELVFKAVMYPDEFKAAGEKTQTTSTRSTSFKPVKAQQRQEALTPEFIERRLAESDGDEWYEAHKDEINNVVKNYTLQFKDVNFGNQ